MAGTTIGPLPFEEPQASIAAHNSMQQQQQEMRPPSQRRFSFSVSHLWKSNSTMLNWLTDVPSFQRDETLQTLESNIDHGEKHGLGDAYDGHDGGEHREKRVKRNSGVFSLMKGGKPRRRRNIVQSTRRMARSVSSSLHRMFAAPTAGIKIEGSATSPNRDYFPLSPAKPQPRQRLRCIVIGDSGCGKTSMLLRYYRNTFNEEWTPTQYELFNKTTIVDEKPADLEIWDTSGKIELNQLSLLSYMSWDAVFLCFSVNSGRSFVKAQAQWVRQVRIYCPNAPIFFIGLKKDLRVGTGLWAPLFPASHARIGASEGAMAANAMGAMKYMECSAFTGDGVDGIFEQSVRMIREIQDEQEAGPKDGARSGLGDLLCF